MAPPRIWVIGDIHGCAGELDVLLDALAPQDEDSVVGLGDYVDRGPSSREVVERLIRLRREVPNAIYLRGNHEDMFLDYLGRGGTFGEAFLGNGGAATVRSYAIEGYRGARAASRMPEEHLAFFADLLPMHTVGSFFCVHAGVRRTLPLDEQRVEDLYWIRDEFVSADHPFPVTVLFGHTPFRDVMLDLPFKIGLDTGAVYGNMLSALDLNSGELVQVRAGTRQIRRRQISLTSGDPG